MSSSAPRKFAAKVIIAGAPAAGKGTQCEMIKSEFGLVHLSTGDILRASVQQGTPLGLQAKAFMDGGQLVPDELIIGVICDRLKEKDCEVNGWLLDGFPRTKSQADALSAAGMIPDCFVMLDVPEEVLVERVTGRRTDPVTGKIYHMKFNPPTDDVVIARLVQRSDDTAEKIIVRYREFQSHIDSIKSCYEDKMVRVDGSIAQAAVSKCVSVAIQSSIDKIKSPSSNSILKVIIAGAPAAGKGTQCEMIKSEFGLVHLSTGDILRASVQQGTPLGLQAKAFMDGGQLVPDELIIGVICDRLKEKDCEVNGWLLDGFPRTKSQADALSAAGMIPDCFVMLDVPEEVLVERVTGRRTDPVTGKIYHMKFNPPTDDVVIARLVQRSDDTAEKIIVRYREFQSHIDSIKSCYEDKMVRVDGSIAQAAVSKCVSDILDSAALRKLGIPVSIADDSAEGVSPGKKEAVSL